jgi:hypothetical protein
MIPAVPLLNLYAQWSRIAIDSQRVISIRLLGIAGVLPAKPGENDRMLREKWLALMQASMGAALAMQRGAAPVAIALAATAPVARATRANSRRLG